MRGTDATRSAQRDLTLGIAEAATAGVTHHLRRGETLIAAPLQTLAAAAWAATHDHASTDDVRAAAGDALDALRAVHGAAAVRGFVTGILERLDAIAAHPVAGRRLASMDDLRELLADSGGHASLRAGTLRAAYGAARLDTAVRIGIDLALEELGVGHIPEEIPNRARDWVRLYLRDHPVGMLIDGVRMIGPDDDRLMRLGARMIASGEG